MPCEPTLAYDGELHAEVTYIHSACRAGIDELETVSRPLGDRKMKVKIKEDVYMSGYRTGQW